MGISIPYSRTNGVALGIKDGDHVNVIVSWAVVDIDQQFQTLLPNRSTVGLAANALPFCTPGKYLKLPWRASAVYTGELIFARCNVR